jgi:hypothetical protein
MNDRLPYDDLLAGKLNELPLPDENMAWEDMKKRLEEDERDHLFPIWFTGCGVWVIGALLIVAIGWWLARPEKWFTDQKERHVILNTMHDSSSASTENSSGINLPQTGKTKDTTSTKSDSQNIPGITVNKPGQVGVVNQNTLPVASEKERTHSKIHSRKSNTKIVATTLLPGKNIKTNSSGQPRKDSTVSSEITTNQPPSSTIIRSLDKPVKDVSTTLPDSNTKINTDSVQKKLPDTSKIKASVSEKNTKKDSSKKKVTFFAAGLGLHQLVPIDGQKLTPYNSAGRRGSLADYIPSIYFRMYKENTWFLHAEFRYGAPQYNREFLYGESAVIQTVGQDTISTITSTRLKKTFYHQVPVSFNYYILKDWSLGAGFVWNRFAGAVSERDINRRSSMNQTDTIISKGVILKSSSRDSNFVKSYFQASFETQYQWKRFSIGGRYSFGLQPYIKFGLAGGAAQQEKNKTLQLFLRYDLWRSRR